MEKYFENCIYFASILFDFLHETISKIEILTSIEVSIEIMTYDSVLLEINLAAIVLRL